MLAAIRRKPRRETFRTAAVRSMTELMSYSVSMLETAIVYQDRWVVVLNKTSGMLAVPGRGDRLRDSLAVRVQQQFAAAAVVHRLDRDTSGLMIMALDAESHRQLSRQFECREVRKGYYAVVAGAVRGASGLIDLAIRKDFARPPRHMVDQEYGRPAMTRWEVIDRRSSQTLLALRPITGRSHQLRIHLAAAGHPILGDNLYAPRRARMAAPRLLLHAGSLAVRHPDSGEPIEWRIPCPFAVEAD